MMRLFSMDDLAVDSDEEVDYSKMDQVCTTMTLPYLKHWSNHSQISLLSLFKMLIFLCGLWQGF